MVDKETVKQLESKLKAERTTCGETALYFAGMFLFHSGKADKAREYVDRMLKMSPQSKEVGYSLANSKNCLMPDEIKQLQKFYYSG